MWTLNSSWLRWLDNLERKNGPCDGLSHCRAYGNVSIDEGLRLCANDPEFRHGWSVWAFKNSESASDDFHKALVVLALAPDDDCSKARARHLLRKHQGALTVDELEIVNRRCGRG